ncbi:hypothetical protein [Paenibacillus taichungensis]|uniref:hypothetical protein n=1 Tax=Paenibacillus taichungensis TaxID=484184 RepID=UPI0038D123BC
MLIHSTTMFNRNRHLDAVSGQIYTFALQQNNSFSTIGTTYSYNSEYSAVAQQLQKLRFDTQQQLHQLPNGDTSMRQKGVLLGWKYEQAEVALGGDGTTNWNKDQRQEILETGRVKYAEGHHINSVKNHPSDQANPDNILFAKNREEHQAMHNGDFRNQTTGQMIDRDQRLEQTNHNRVIKNELTGIGLAAAIGLGVGFTLGFVTTLAQNGFKATVIKTAFVSGANAGLEGAALAVTNHVIVRGIGEATTMAFALFSTEYMGLILTENLLKMCSMTTVGLITVGVSLTYQFLKLKFMGADTKQALKSVEKSAKYSLAVLFISIVAQGIWGGHAGLIVSISIGSMTVLWKLIQNEAFKKLFEEIQHYMIIRLKPCYA